MTDDICRVARRLTSSTPYIVNENASITESAMAWDSIGLITKKLACLVRASTEIAEDAIGFAEFAVAELAWAIENQIDNIAFNGDGTSTYAGITGALHAITGASAVAATRTHKTFLTVSNPDMVA